jgi:hypothetical protein
MAKHRLEGVGWRWGETAASVIFNITAIYGEVAADIVTAFYILIKLRKKPFLPEYGLRIASFEMLP